MLGGSEMIRVTAVAVLLVVLGAGCSKEQQATSESAEPAMAAKSIEQTPVEALPMAPDEVMASCDGAMGSADEPMAMVPEDTEMMSDEDLAAMDETAESAVDSMMEHATGLKDQVTEA